MDRAVVAGRDDVDAGYCLSLSTPCLVDGRTAEMRVRRARRVGPVNWNDLKNAAMSEASGCVEFVSCCAESYSAFESAPLIDPAGYSK